jgi:preprotein translocase subunit SecB
MAKGKETPKKDKSKATLEKVGGTQDQTQMSLPLTVNAQYIKDLSFEHPEPLRSFQAPQGSPDIGVHLDVSVQNVQDRTFEVTLTIRAEALQEKKPLFVTELQYAGIFTLGQEVPENTLHPILMIECPRLLFPFARSILASVTREGGFPPLSLNPIDFAGLYQQQLEKQEKPH